MSRVGHIHVNYQELIQSHSSTEILLGIQVGHDLAVAHHVIYFYDHAFVDPLINHVDKHLDPYASVIRQVKHFVDIIASLHGPYSSHNCLSGTSCV